MFGAPVDLSFKQLSSMADAMTEEHRQGLRPLRRNAEGKFCSRALRLNNNKIREMIGFNDAVNAFLSRPSEIAWIDLSHNVITRIDSVLTELPELRVLYLHGNNISKLSEVDKLQVLPSLHTLTLHGNPVEAEKGYRAYVIATLPRLKSLDFCAVTKQEKVMANIWNRGSTQDKHSTKKT
ncbi:leucine rich repeat containing 51 [Megalops cyprinoides]|uniref:leucine rich repeat containing 51 n=1 Tax=Megalops cyprinoides TaxID=118141 RepID=UPI001864C908|nr:leucine rich repeat containing 51 [Megalops cyprinoides]